MPEDISDKINFDMPNRMPQGMSDKVPKDMSDKISSDMPNRMPQNMSDKNASRPVLYYIYIYIYILPYLILCYIAF